MNVKGLLVSVAGGVIFMLIVVYVLTPLIQGQLYKFGANSQIKAEQRCEKYKNEYVDILFKKENMNPLLEKAKQDKCLK